MTIYEDILCLAALGSVTDCTLRFGQINWDNDIQLQTLVFIKHHKNNSSFSPSCAFSGENQKREVQAVPHRYDCSPG